VSIFNQPVWKHFKIAYRILQSNSPVDVQVLSRYVYYPIIPHSVLTPYQNEFKQLDFDSSLFDGLVGNIL